MKRAQTKRFNFTKRGIEAMPPPDRGRRNFYDLESRSLGLAVYSSGSKSFFWFRSVAGIPTYRSLGFFPDVSVEQARQRAADLNKSLSSWKGDNFEGRDPFEKRERTTLEAAIEFYIDKRLRAEAKNFERAAKETRWLRDHYLNAWKGWSLASIRRKHVIERHYEIRRDHGLYSANRVLQLLKAVFNFMVEIEKWDGANPCARIKLFKEQRRKRFLQPDELPKLFAALQTERNLDLRDFTLLALTTGARRGDILSARWNHFHLGRNVWTIPHPKNETPYEVKLSTQAVSVLADRRQRVEGEFVFPSNSKRGHVLDLKRSWKQLLTRAEIADLRVHDLRRTLASWQATAGSSLLIIGKSLGHTSVQATEVYSQVADDAVRDSVAKAAKKMFTTGKVSVEKLLGAPRE